MDFGNLIQQAAILALPLLFAITLSEAARGHAAYWLGDKTGWSQGRMTWNPTNHISPVETIVIPMVMFLATSGSFIFGSAKPIPIDYRNVREPKKTSAIWIEMASPIALFVMALVWYLVLIALQLFQVDEPFFLKEPCSGVACMVNVPEPVCLSTCSLLPPLDWWPHSGVFCCRCKQAMAQCRKHRALGLLDHFAHGAGDCGRALSTLWMQPVMALTFRPAGPGAHTLARLLTR